MDDHRRHLGRGFNWLGGATVIARVVDFATILAVLMFLTKAEVGTASLVISIGMMIEALDGLGTGDAMVQAPVLTPHVRDTLFWVGIASSLAVALLTLLAAPLIAALYGMAGMAGYFAAIAAKQPLVAGAVVPMALMNRDLQYERIAIVNVGATLAAALTRLGLAVAGAGAWSLVIGFAASGFFTLLGAWIARPFRPGWRPDLPAVLPLLRFGLQSMTANLFTQTFKNVDYLLVGWFYGPAPLAVYRVAFDVAMEPAMAVSTLLNRTALPVFARVAAVRDHLAQTFAWSLGRVAVLVAPLMAGLVLAAGPLMALLHDESGHSYAAAALPLRILAVAALLRTCFQLLSPVMMGSGQPGLAARLSAATLLLLSIGVAAAGILFPPRPGIVAVSAVWLVVYPLLWVWGRFYLRRRWDLRLRDLARAFRVPALAIAGQVALVLVPGMLAGDDNRIRLGIVIAATALTYAALFLYTRRKS